MEFRIADTFTDSLGKLTGQEQKAVKTTAFDLQIDPANPGLRFHKLDRVQDPNFWSVSVNMDLRVIVHRTEASLMLCYVDHHDNAYNWARKRKIARHPKTGAAQLVEVRETIQEIIIPKTIEVETLKSKPAKLFGHLSEEDLLNYGIPPEWVQDVKTATEDTLFEIAEHLPQEAAEALLELATGGTPQPPVTVSSDADPFAHPDAQRRFRVMSNQEELQRALEYPWEKWTVFLHPAQRHYVERQYNGPARISGSAGTGKTIVALHRAVFLARQHPDAQILLTTFSQTLAIALRLKLKRLIGNEPDIFSRIQVHPIKGIARKLYGESIGSPNIIESDALKTKLAQIASQTDHPFSLSFLWGEWKDVVDPWQITTWDAYKTVPRLGRKTRLGNKQREILWSVFEQLLQDLQDSHSMTWNAVFSALADHLSAQKTSPFEFAIADESQDLGIAELKFLAALGHTRPDSLFFTGDLGQRIFQQPFSWKSLGVKIQGRSHSLKINYRTSHQIRLAADRLLPESISDVDGNPENRSHTISVFNGPIPKIKICEDETAEIQFVSNWLSHCLQAGIKAEEIGVFVRDTSLMDRAISAIEKMGLSALELHQNDTYGEDSIENAIIVSTMHLAKGLEFRAVIAMACDDEVIPLQERIENISDEADLEEVYNTERHLLYVACTRARDLLLVCGIDPASEFLDDLAYIEKHFQAQI